MTDSGRNGVVRRSVFVGVAALCATALCAVSAWAGKPTTYKWVDEQGVVHYGDSIPPQYAQQASTELNSQGVVVGYKDATKTPQQQAAEAAAKAAADKQKQHDNFLLGTYTSVKDIEQQRDEQLDQFKGQRAATEQYVQTLSERLGQLQTRAQNFRPYNTRPDARKMPDDLAEQMVHTLNDIKTQKAALAASDQDEVAAREKFQADIRRFQELRALHDAP